MCLQQDAPTLYVSVPPPRYTTQVPWNGDPVPSFLSSSGQPDMLIRVQGTNLELSDELYAFVKEKLDDAFRALGDLDRDPVQVDVELEETTRRHPQELEDQRLYRAETNITVPGRLIRAEGSADTLQQSIVEMKHRLTREIREWREKMIDERREGARRAKVELGEEIEAEQYEGLGDEYEERYVEELGEFGTEGSGEEERESGEASP